MANWITYLIVGWTSFGLGMAFAAYLLLSDRHINLEHNVISPQKMLAEWVQQ